MATHLPTVHTAVVHRLEPRRRIPAVTPTRECRDGSGHGPRERMADQGKGQLLYFFDWSVARTGPPRPKPEEVSRRGQLAGRAPAYGLAVLVEAVLQTNLRATAAVLRMSSPASFLEFQQRVVSEYVAAVMGSTVALAHT